MFTAHRIKILGSAVIFLCMVVAFNLLSSDQRKKLEEDKFRTTLLDPLEHENRSTTIGILDVQEDLDSGPKYILVMAYPRSGSSFTAELLSIGSGCFYIYEPSFEFRRVRRIKDPKKGAQVLERIYNCDPIYMSILTVERKSYQPLKFFWPKYNELLKKNETNKTTEAMTAECISSKYRFIKTIRYDIRTAKNLFEEFPKLNIKIIHLVRDPRAILASLDKDAAFNHRNKTPDYQCSVIRRNLNIGDTIPKTNYMMVRYEDIVNNTMKAAIQLYNFIEKPMTTDVAVHIATHVRPDNFFNNTALTSFYYSTFRKSDFDPNHWRKSIKPEQKKLIDNYCSDVLEKMGYEI